MEGVDEAHTVNLLLIENDDSEPVARRHYALIKNLSRLLFGLSKAHHKQLICMRCLRGYDFFHLEVDIYLTLDNNLSYNSITHVLLINFA